MPRTGSRLSVSSSSRPTALTSVPRSSDCTSSENAGGLAFHRRWHPAKARSFLAFHFRESRSEFRRLFTNLDPVEKGVGILEPDAKPVRYLLLFLAFVRFDLVVARNHFRPPLAQPRDLQHPLGGGFLLVGAESPQQFVKTHQADFGIAQRLEMKQIFELFLELIFRFFL